MSEIVKAEHKPEIMTKDTSALRFVPNTPEGVFRLAQLTVKSGMAPKQWPTHAEGVFMCLATGFELGLNYTQTINGIMIVNGRPKVWGDVALALCWRHASCVSIREWIDKDTAYCECVRKGNQEPIARKFTVDDAKKAGLWGKSGPWSQYPNRMLQMRARAFALRDAFADALNGMGIAEEALDTEMFVADGQANVPSKAEVAQSKIDLLPELPQETDLETTVKPLFDVDELAAQMGDKQ